MRRHFTRTASTLITLFGCVTNAVLAIQLAAAWRSFIVKGEQETEWEALSDKWQTSGLRLVWGILCVYFASSATVSAVGLYGVLRAKASLVRCYRDYSIADFVFCAVSAVAATYVAFIGPARAGLCEELSHHPDLMRDMLEMGLNLENCELWLERAVFAIVVVMFVVMVVRLHFLLAVSNYHIQLTRYHFCHHSHSHSRPLQRILLVPNQIHTRDVEIIYAPVPKGSLPKELLDRATEAWVSTTSSIHHHGYHHRHSRYHHRFQISSKDRTGTIRLDIQPGEGLLPPYDSSEAVHKV